MLFACSNFVSLRGGFSALSREMAGVTNHEKSISSINQEVLSINLLNRWPDEWK